MEGSLFLPSVLQAFLFINVRYIVRQLRRVDRARNRSVRYEIIMMVEDSWSSTFVSD